MATLGIIIPIIVWLGIIYLIVRWFFKRRKNKI